MWSSSTTALLLQLLFICSWKLVVHTLNAVVVPVFTDLPDEINYVNKSSRLPISKTFVCQAEPRNQVTIHFLSSKNGGPLKQLTTSPNEGIRIDVSGKLLLTNWKRKRVHNMIRDKEVFHCKATVGQSVLLSRPFRLEFSYIRGRGQNKKAQNILKGNVPKVFLKGNVAKLDCKLPESNPPAVSIFKINGTRVFSDDRFRIIKVDNNRTHALLISDLKISDCGLYSCWAENPITSQTVYVSAFNVTVVGPDTEAHPAFISRPASYIMMEGENASFTCVIKSAPVASIKFRRSNANNLLSDLPSSRFTSEPNFGLLTLQGATLEDTGNYHCRVNYKRKEDSTTKPLIAEFRILVKRRLQILQNLTDTQVTQESNGATFTCRLNGESTATPEWYINGNQVTSENMIGVRLTENKLVVLKPETRYYGVVQCVYALDNFWLSSHATFSALGSKVFRGEYPNVEPVVPTDSSTGGEEQDPPTNVDREPPGTGEGERPDSHELNSAIDKPQVEWKYINLVIFITWKIKPSKINLAARIQHFKIGYKGRHISKRSSMPWDSISPLSTDQIVRNKFFLESSRLHRAKRLAFGSPDAVDTVEEQTPDRQDRIDDNVNEQQLFSFALQNVGNSTLLKPQFEYIVQVKYNIGGNYYESEWSTELAFDSVLEIAPPVIVSVSPENHSITWRYEDGNLPASNFVILTRRLGLKSRDDSKRYLVQNAAARKYYFHDLKEDVKYEVRMYAEFTREKRTDLSISSFIIPQKIQATTKMNSVTDDSNTWLFIIIGSLVGFLILFLAILAIVYCVKQRCRKLQTRGTFKDPAKAIHRETLLRSQMQPATHNSFSLSMLNGGPLSHGVVAGGHTAASTLPYKNSDNLHVTSNPLDARGEMETALMHDYYAQNTNGECNQLSGGLRKATSLQHGNFNYYSGSKNMQQLQQQQYLPPDYYGNGTLKREPPSGVSRQNSTEEIEQSDTLYQRGPGSSTFRSGYSTTSSHPYHAYQQQQQQQQQQHYNTYQQQMYAQQLAVQQQMHMGAYHDAGMAGQAGSQFGSSYRLQQQQQQQLHASHLGSHQGLYLGAGIQSAAATTADNESVYSYFSQLDSYVQTPHLVEQSCQTADRNPQHSSRQHRRRRRRHREPEMAAGASAANHAILEHPAAAHLQRDMATNTLEEETAAAAAAAAAASLHGQEELQTVLGVPPLPSYRQHDLDTTYEHLPEDSPLHTSRGNMSMASSQQQHHMSSTPNSSLRSRRSQQSAACYGSGPLSTVKEHTPPLPPVQFAGGASTPPAKQNSPSPSTAANQAAASSLGGPAVRQQLLRSGVGAECSSTTTAATASSLSRRGVSPLFSDPPRMRDISDYAIPEAQN